METIGARGVIHLVTIPANDDLVCTELCLDIELRCVGDNNYLLLRETGTEGWELVSNLSAPEFLPLVNILMGVIPQQSKVQSSRI